VIDFDLPANATTAALALVLGVLLGAGGMWYFTAESAPDTDLAKLGEMEGVLEQKLDRGIAEEDTADQDEADLRVKYRTKTDTVRDSVYVPVPSNLSNTPQLSSSSPISVTENKVTWTHFDPAERQWQQDVFAVPSDPLSFRAHVLARAWAPFRDISLSAERMWAGVGLSLRYRRLSVALNGLTTPSLSRQRVEVGLRWRLSGSP
jgi:hypothetical protein